GTVRLEVLNHHGHVGHDAGFLARIQRVVDRLLDAGQQRLARVVEAEQMAVLGEELADRDVLLPGCHGFGSFPPADSVAVSGRDWWHEQRVLRPLRVTDVPLSHCVVSSRTRGYARS